jgi:hypothetical protein
MSKWQSAAESECLASEGAAVCLCLSHTQEFMRGFMPEDKVGNGECELLALASKKSVFAIRSKK